MPTYEYRCKKCDRRFELFHGIRDRSVKRCPRCKGRAERVPSAGAGILFRGSGFYVTDYRSRDYRDRAKKEKAAAPAEGGSGEAKKSADGRGAAGKKKKGADAEPSRG